MALILAIFVSTQTQAQLQQRPFAMVNVVTDFSATPDDKTDDDAIAFQKALNYVAQTPGLAENFAIFIPPGKYHFYTPLVFSAPKQLTIIGSGPVSTHLVPWWNGSTDFFLRISPGPDAGPDDVCGVHLANFGISWLSDATNGPNSWTKGIQISGVSGDAMIDNLRMHVCKGTALELHPGHINPRDTYKEVVEEITIRSTWFVGPTDGPGYTEPVIRAAGPLPSARIRVEDCIIHGGGSVKKKDSRSIRPIVEIEAGEEWVFAYNKFSGSRTAAVRAGTLQGLSRGMRFIGNGFEGIGVTDLLTAPRDKNNCLIYIKGRSNESEYPFIGFSSFVHPALRTIVLEDVQHAVVMDMSTRSTNIIMEGASTSNNLLPLAPSFKLPGEMNAWMYPTDTGYAFTNGLTVASNQALEDRGALNAGIEKPYVAWEIFGPDIGLDDKLDLAEANARFTLENNVLDAASDSVLVAKVGGLETMKLHPDRVETFKLESTRALITNVDAITTEIQTLKIDRLEFGPNHLVNAGNLTISSPTQALKVVDSNGNLFHIWLHPATSNNSGPSVSTKSK